MSLIEHPQQEAEVTVVGWEVPNDLNLYFQHL